MSLLQDALRKAQKGGEAPRPQEPSPLPDLPSRKPETRWKLLAGVVAAAFVVGAAGVFLLIRRPAPAEAPLAQAPPPAVPAAAATEAPGPTVAAAPTLATPSAQVSTPARALDGKKTARPEVSPLPQPSAAAGGKARAAGQGKGELLERFNEGAAALERGDAPEAARRFREVTEASPEVVEAWNGLGIALLRQKKLDEADQALSRVLSLAPRFAPGLLNAGLLRLEQGRTEEGAALFARAAEASPESPVPRVNLAAAQARLGRLAEAEETLLNARARFPGDPGVLYQLGTLYERIGNREKCADAYSAFLAASGGARPALEEKVRERLRSLAPQSRLDAATPTL
ncbi:MAG: tetratricopeptide repeat protein [Thermodesulfobacteriota bacterium]